MAGYSRPATLEDLKTLIGALNDQGSEYLLIGGYALLAHGFQRAWLVIEQALKRQRDPGG